MRTEGKEGKTVVARIAGMIVARIGGSNPPITDALTKAEEILCAVLKTEIRCEHVYEVAEIAGIIFAQSCVEDLRDKARVANSVQWATQIAQLTGIR
jgi:hypothetical protein